MTNKLSLKITLNYKFFCDISLTLYLFALFGYQDESTVGTLVRYGTFFMALFFYFLGYIKLDGYTIQGYEVWILGFYLFAASSFLWCIDPGNLVTVLNNGGKVVIICCLLLPMMNSREKIEHTLRIVLLAMCMMAVRLFLKTPLSMWGSSRIGYDIGLHPNMIGRLAAIAAVIAFYLSRKDASLSIFYDCIVILFSVIALLSGSKNALLMLLFQLGLFYYLCSGNLKRIFVVAAVVVLSGVVFWLVMTVPVLYNLIGVRFERFLMVFIGGDVDGSTKERVYFMKTAWELFLKNPALGIGLNNFSAYLRSINYINPVYSHAGFLEILSTLGTVGFTIYYSMYVFLMTKLYKPARKRDLTATVLFVIILVIFVFDISCLSIYNYNLYIFAMIGYAMVQCIREENSNIPLE